MPKCDLNGLEDLSQWEMRGRTRLLCKRGACVARTGMLLFYGVGSASRLRGEAGNEIKSMRGAEQVSRYVKPCFMRWFLTAEGVCLGRTARAGLEAYRSE